MFALTPTLTTERLTLAVLHASYAEAVTAYFARNRSYMQPWNPLVDDAFFTVDWQAARLENDLAMFQADRAVRFWLFEQIDTRLERVIGHVALSNIIRGALQGCHLGYMIDQAEAGKGLITEAAQCVIAYGFTDLGLHRIEANIMPRNHASLRVVEKLGFTREGFSPRYLRINGVWEDHYRYGLVQSDEMQG